MKNWWRELGCLFSSKADPEKVQDAAKIKIETPRLVLREFEPEDIDRIHEISSMPGFFYYCFDGTREKSAEFVQSAIDSQKPDMKTGKRENVLLAVALKDTGHLVGHVSIEAVDHRPGVDDYEINFFTDPAVQKKGYGREAAVNMMRYGFEDMGLDDYIVTIHPKNAPSQRVAITEGYVKVGETKIMTSKGEQPRDMLVLTKEAFYNQRARDKRPMFEPAPSGPQSGPQ